MAKKQEKLDLLRRALGEEGYNNLFGCKLEAEEEILNKPRSNDSKITEQEIDMISNLVDKIGRPNCYRNAPSEFEDTEPLLGSVGGGSQTQSLGIPYKGTFFSDKFFKNLTSCNINFDNIGAEHPAVILRVLESSSPNRKIDLLRCVDGPTARAVIRLSRNSSSAVS